MKMLRHTFISQKLFLSLPVVVGLFCSAAFSGMGFSTSNDLLDVQRNFNSFVFYSALLLLILWNGSFLWTHVNKFYISKKTAYLPFGFSLIAISILYLLVHSIYFFGSVNPIYISQFWKNQPSLKARLFIDGLTSMGVFLTVPVLWENHSKAIESIRQAREQLIRLLAEIQGGQNLSPREERKMVQNLETIATSGSDLEQSLASEWDRSLLCQWKSAADEHWRTLGNGNYRGGAVEYFGKKQRAKELSETLKIKIFNLKDAPKSGSHKRK